MSEQQQRLIREKLNDIFTKHPKSGKIHTFEAILTMLILTILSYFIAQQSYQIVVVTFFAVFLKKQKKKHYINERVVIYLGITIQLTSSVVLLIQNSTQHCQNFLITIAFLLFVNNRYNIKRTLIYSVAILNMIFQIYLNTQIILMCQYIALLIIGIESSIWFKVMVNQEISIKIQEFNNELTNIFKIIKTQPDSQLNTRAYDILKKLRMLKFKKMVYRTQEKELSEKTRNFSMRQLPDELPYQRKGQRMMSSATEQQQCKIYENSNSGSFQELEEITIEDIDDLLNLLSGKKEQIWLPKFLSSTQTEEYSNDAKEFLLSHFTQSECEYIHDQRISSSEYHKEAIDFNTDFLDQISTRKFLEMTLKLLNRFKLPQTLKITKPEILGEFVMKVDKSYFPNLYHNSMHALDVMNSSAFFLENGLNHLIDEFEQACLLISSLAHDIGHPGLNNGFLTTNKCKLALLYNDQSVLENYHAFLLFQILKQDQCNLIINLGQVEQKVFRKYCLNMILDTDLTRHFQLMNKFQNYLELSESQDLDKSLVMSICIKCADVGHGAKQLRMHKQWSRRIIEEFFLQGDLEQHLGVTISPMCDRKQNVSKSQEGFLKAIVLPMFSAFSNLLQNEIVQKVCLHQIQENIHYWQQQQSDDDFMQEMHMPTSGIEQLKKFLNQPLQLSV